MKEKKKRGKFGRVSPEDTVPPVKTKSPDRKKANGVGLPPDFWSMEKLLTVYKWAKKGLSDEKISELLGITYNIFLKHKKNNSNLRYTIHEARGTDTASGTEVEKFHEFVFGRLPSHLQDLWKDIERCEDEPNLVSKVELMLANCGRRAKQHLFLYALVHYNFSLTMALKSIGLKRKHFEKWVLDDPDFGEMLDEVHLAKKDFFESSLVGLVKQGDAAAIIFANKTLNNDRGYNPSKQMTVNKNVNVQHNHTHTAVPIEQLGLSVEERKRILEAFRSSQESRVIPATPTTT